MYREGILNEEEAVSLLSIMGYKSNNIQLLLAREDLKQHAEYEKTVVSNIKKLYIGGMIDRTDVFAQMGKLATPSNFIEQSLTVWDLEKFGKKELEYLTFSLEDGVRLFTEFSL